MVYGPNTDDPIIFLHVFLELPDGAVQVYHVGILMSHLIPQWTIRGKKW